MYDFTQNKANKQSISKRSPIFGVGINDADYLTNFTVDGKVTSCHFYRKWHGMIRRCYSSRLHKIHPTYINCIVADEWLIFSNFRKWMVSQSWEGLELDKDIKVKGNKIYSHKYCLFIPRSLNTLFNTHKNSRGEYPLGVSWSNERNKFVAQINFNGHPKSLGRFNTIKEAEQAYISARKDKILSIISMDIYPMATEYLSNGY